MRFTLFALACVATAVSFGSTIRHDRADSLYTTLDNNAPFSSVGRVNVTGGLGSGTYIGFGGGSHWVLTAAHVASNISQNPNFNVTGTNIAVTQVIAFSGWGLNNNDFSLLRLASDPGVAAVPFYNGALELGRRAGTGPRNGERRLRCYGHGPHGHQRRGGHAPRLRERGGLREHER